MAAKKTKATGKKTAAKKKVARAAPAKKRGRPKRVDGPSWSRQWKPMDGGVATEAFDDAQQKALVWVLRELMAQSLRHTRNCYAHVDPLADCDCPYSGEDMFLHVLSTLGNMRLVHREAQQISLQTKRGTGTKARNRRKKSTENAKNT